MSSIGSLGSPSSVKLLSPTTMTTDSAGQSSAQVPTSGIGSPNSGGGQVGVLSPAQTGATPYSSYKIDTRYITDSGLWQAPLAKGGSSGAPAGISLGSSPGGGGAGGGATCALVQLHQPVTRKIVKWVAERVGAQPILPHWDTGNANEVLLHKEIMPCSSWCLADGSDYIYHREGEYHYALLVPTGENDSMYSGAIPALNNPSALESINGSMFSRSILQAT